MTDEEFDKAVAGIRCLGNDAPEERHGAEDDLVKDMLIDIVLRLYPGDKIRDRALTMISVLQEDVDRWYA